MEVSTESTNVAGTESQSSTPDVSGTPSGSTPAVPNGANVQAAPEGSLEGVPAYQPNFKYKVDMQEREFDELFRGLVKDPDTEKKIREFHEKAYGLDAIKPRYQKLREEHKELLEGKYTPLTKRLSVLSTHLNQGDFDSFFHELKIPQKLVQDWMLQKLQREQMPPEQRQAYEEAERLKRENAELQREREEWQTTSEQSRVQARAYELDTVLSRPEVRNVMTSYETRRGPGAFRDFVVNHATATYFRTGQDIPAEQAVSESLAILGHQAAASQPNFGGQPQAMPGMNGQQVDPATGQARPPVIPNVSGRNVSPAAKKPKSIEDLRAISKKFTSTHS